MRFTRGIQSEVLLSLAVLVATAIGLLAAFLLRTQSSHDAQLEGLLGRALAAEASAAVLGVDHSVSGARWHLFRSGEEADGIGVPQDAPSELIDLVHESRRLEQPLLSSGTPWRPVLFAAPLGPDSVAAAWFPPVVSRTAIGALILADIAVFVGLGAYLLRRRVTGPLARLAAATQELRHGERSARAPVAGVEEVAELARDFNAMGDALDERTAALEKAVSDLRGANRELRQTRAGLDRAERLAAVGSLAAGVAHEVGNPMGAVLAFLDLARKEGAKDGLGEHGQALLAKAAREGDRVRVIIRQLLDFSRPPEGTRVPVSFVAVCEQTLDLVQAQTRYAAISYGIESEPELPQVSADASLLAQVLLNLVVNASDAVAGTGSRVVLRASALRPRPSRRRRAGRATQSRAL